MKYFSTRSKNNFVSFKESVLQGLAKDGGLFIPEKIPQLPKSFFNSVDDLSFQDISYTVAREFVDDEIPEQQLHEIIEASVNFPAPLVQVDENLFVLELFHGPTLAFKDFGARFMARTMEYFVKDSNKELVILVATSGDTGSAVANGFYNVHGIKVVLLYPSGKVSYIQEKQLTTLDKNITALEIQGTFDDCQRLVKEAFLDKQLNEKINLSSANSINIARLIPQSFYYLNAFKQLKDKTQPIIISVPSGNLGNLTAGLFAKKMGLPVEKFIAATNRNDIFTEFLKTAQFNPRKSVQTLSNAMDVGNPSNIERIQSLYNDDIKKIRADIFSETYDDAATVDGIKELFEKSNYVIDPHGSVGYLALKNYMERNPLNKANGIVVETAHPAKFKDAVEDAIKKEVEIPERLAGCIKKEKKAVLLGKNFPDMKEFLLNNYK